MKFSTITLSSISPILIKIVKDSFSLIHKILLFVTEGEDIFLRNDGIKKVKLKISAG